MQSNTYHRIKNALSRLSLHLGLLLLALVAGFPIYWVFAVSITPSEQVYTWPLQFWPATPTLEHYVQIFTRDDLIVYRWFLNSLFVSSVATFLCLFVSSLTAYAFARLEFPGRDAIFKGLLFTMMVPIQATLVPVFILMQKLGWLDSYHALIWPATVNVFGVFLLRQFFLSVPKELEEAAFIDGAGRFRIYWQIVLPLVKPGLIALGIFVFLATWNDLFWPLIVMNRLEMRTLPVGLAVLAGTYTQERALVMAGAVVATLPALVVYAIFQRRIIRGVMMTGMGGR